MATTLKIPDDIVKATGRTEHEFLVELAVHLYAERRLKLGHALRLSGLGRLEFENELAQRNISLYTVDDLHDDVATLKELGRL